MEVEFKSRPLDSNVCCCCSINKSRPALCNPMDCSMLGFPVLHCLPRVCINSCPLSRWYHPPISSSVVPSSSCLQSFPALGSFPTSWLFASGSQKYWSFSFIISPSYEHSGSISLWLTSLISLQSKGLSRLFSSTTVWKHQFFGAQPSLWSSSHIHT